MSRYKIETGYTNPLFCKGVGRAPCAIRWKGRWYQLATVFEGGSERNAAPPADLEPLDYGLFRLRSYLDRRRIHFGDLPIFDPENRP